MSRGRIIVIFAACALAIGASGCQKNYYRVRDTANADNAYYTTKYKSRRGGTISFTDSRSGAKVTLQNSAVQRISREEWNGAVDK
jgi:hypothetical protein